MINKNWLITLCVIILLVIINLGVVDYQIFVKPKPTSNLPVVSPSTEFSYPTSSSPTVTTVTISLPKPTTVSKKTQEYFITLGGSGSSTAKDWEDLTGIEAYVDSNNYQSIKEVVFEVSAIIPNGNQTVWFRLYNVTAKHPVWYSDVSMEGGGGKLLNSQPISLESGKNLYRAQVKTSLGSSVNLLQSRLKIITQE